MRAAILFALCLLPVSCAPRSPDPLTAPRTLTTPYDPSRGEVLWAVVPLRNESGTLEADAVVLADKLVAAADEAQGVRAVPLNRTLEAMRALNLRGVRTPPDARRLAQAMGVDAVLVGSVTAYDPYTPTIGLSLALFVGPGAMQASRSALSPRELATTPTDTTPPQSRFQEAPLASTSLHLDAKNNQVLMEVRAFAQGRVGDPSALGWRRYVASANLYAEFAAYRAVDDLLRQEWLRLGRVTTQEPPAREH